MLCLDSKNEGGKLAKLNSLKALTLCLDSKNEGGKLTPAIVRVKDCFALIPKTRAANSERRRATRFCCFALIPKTRAAN